jgi:RHS repeat-associated protein
MVFNHTGGSVAQDEIFYPWGERWNYAGTLCDERFAAMQLRDAESGLDPTLFRMYESRLYRWLSPDPVAGSIFNPQSLNRYAYVLNNPTNFIDPLGLQGCPGWAGMRQCIEPHHAFTGPPPVKLGYFWGGSRWLYSAVVGWAMPIVTYVEGGTRFWDANLGKWNETTPYWQVTWVYYLIQGGGTVDTPPGPCQPPPPAPPSGLPEEIRKINCELCRAWCDTALGAAALAVCGAGYGTLELLTWSANIPGKIAGKVLGKGAGRMGIGGEIISSIGLEKAAQKCVESFAKQKENCYATQCASVCGESKPLRF